MLEAMEREAVVNPVGTLRDLADSLSDWSEAFESPQPDHDGWALTFWIAKELLRDCIGAIDARGRLVIAVRGDMPLAEALRLGRLAQGRTQRAVGDAAGTDFTNLCRFEKGELLPGPRALKKLAEALGLPYEVLAELAVEQALVRRRAALRKRYGVTDA